MPPNVRTVPAFPAHPSINSHRLLGAWTARRITAPISRLEPGPALALRQGSGNSLCPKPFPLPELQP